MTARTFQQYVATLALVAVALALAARAAGTTRRASFPCGGVYGLSAGSPKGYVRASATADCGGERGTIELRVRLFARAGRGPWRVVRSRARSWRDLTQPHALSLTSPCPTGAVSAAFTWTLRGAAGALTSARTVRTKPITVNARCNLAKP